MAITKVFRIELQGATEVEQGARNISAAYVKMGRDVAAAKKALTEKIQSNAENSLINDLTLKVKELETALKSLSVQKKVADSQSKQQVLTEKQLADIRLKEAKATKEQELANKNKAQADAIVTRSIIDQNKELDRQIALEEKQARQQKINVSAPVGSYDFTNQQRKELYNLSKSAAPGSSIAFQGQLLSYDEAIAKLKELSAAEQSFRRQFQADGTLVGEYSSGIVQAFNKLHIGDIIDKDINGGKAAIQRLEGETRNLVVAYREAQAEGKKDLSGLEGAIHANVVETENLRAKVKEAEIQLHGMGGIGTQITTGIKESFKSLKNDIAQFAIGYFGFQAVFSSAQSLIHQNYELSDSIAQLKIYIHGTTDEANALVDTLKKIDTRTSLANLIDISTIVAKKGVAKEEIGGITQALDQLFVALGKEAGDPHETTSSLVKIISIFNDDKKVTADRIRDLGAALQGLQSHGVATSEYLINFAERVGSIRGITGVTAQSVLGLGAALQQLGQQNEVAGTASVQLLTKIFSDVPKYAAAAGKSVEEFRSTLKNDPITALIDVAKGLKEGKAGFEEVVQSFGEVGVSGARVKAVLADIAGNEGYLREKIAAANVYYGNQAAVLDANAEKQKTFAATLDQIQKKFELIGANRTVQAVLTGVAGALALLFTNLTPIIAALALYGIGWLAVTKEIETAGVIIEVTNGRLILQRLAILGNNIVMGAQRILLGALTLAQVGYNLALALFTRNTALATTAMEVFNIAIKSNPLGILLTILGLVVGAFSAFATTVSRGTEALKAQARQQQLNLEVSKTALQATAKQRSEVELYAKIAKDASLSDETRANAMRKLIEIDPIFRQAMDGQTISVERLNAAVLNFNNSLQKTSELEASKGIQEREFGNLTQLKTLLQDVETAKVAKTGFGDLSNDVKDLFGIKTSAGRNKLSSSLLNIVPVDNDYKIVLDALKARIEAQTKVVDAAAKIYTDKVKAAEKETLIMPKDLMAKSNEVKAFAKLSIEELNDELKKIDEAYDKMAGDDPKRAALAAKRDKYQARIDELNNKEKKTKGYGGAKLTGFERDDLKDIDAEWETYKARLEKAYADQDIFIRPRVHLQFKKDSEGADSLLGTTTQNAVRVDNEKTYLNELLGLNNDYLDKKIATLKKNNAEENKLRAQWELEKVKNIRDTNKKEFDIDNSEIERQLKFKIDKAARDEKLALQNPNLGEVEQLNIHNDFLNKELVYQIDFNQKQAALEKLYKITSIKNAEERAAALEKINDELRQDADRMQKAQVADALKAADEAAQDFQNSEKSRLVEQVNKILEDDKLSAYQKAKKTKPLEDQLAVVMSNSDLEKLRQQVAALKKIYGDDADNKSDYLEKLAEYTAKKNEIDKKSVGEGQSLLNTILSKVFNINTDQYKAQTDALGDLASGASTYADTVKKVSATIKAQAAEFVGQAINSYYQQQDNQIEKDKKNTIDALDRERQRVKARAQSSSEQETIDRIYDEKKRKVEKEAFERTKKLQLQQAAVNYFAGIINAYSAAAPFLANPLTAPIEIPLLIADVALLTGSYALQKSNINKQQFGKGGVPVTTGGPITGPSHADGGVPFEAEGGEIAIINKKSADTTNTYSITGTPMQIASKVNEIGGGVSFLKGAQLSKPVAFASGGYLGTSLKAPNFSNWKAGQLNTPSADTERLGRLEILVENVANAVSSTDKKEVILQTSKVTGAQKRQAKDVSMGTI